MVLSGVASAVGGLAASLIDEAGATSPDKLTITLLNPALEEIGELKAQFNPTAYSITKPVSWGPRNLPANAGQEVQDAYAAFQKFLNAPMLEFGGGGSRTLTLDLFFDVTEPQVQNGQLQKIDDVRDLTNQFVKLSRIDRNLTPPQPPICRLSWGEPLDNPNFPFTGVVTNLVQSFTLFSSDGKPLRAKLTITFKEWLDLIQDLLQTDPEETVWVVKRGDTLSRIASEVYKDPTRWRIIAEANRIDDPLHLDVGRTLTIPSLR
ncbi:MAG: LysM peptidoglycan-binding domain-containing protein [Cyanobacteria bacterium P01_F01_bin.150]